MLAPRKTRLNYNPGKADYARRLLEEDDGKGCRRKVRERSVIDEMG